MPTLRRRRYQVLYPEYFDKNRTRSQGRRVSLDIADESPTLKKLVKACEILKLEFEVEPDKAYPSNWWERRGRVLVRINKSEKKRKEELLKEVSSILRRLVQKKKSTKTVVKKIKKKKKTGKKGPYTKKK